MRHSIALFVNDLSSNLDLNIPVDALILDFEKAFDKVSHKRLFLKFSRLNINCFVLEWIRNFLTNRQQFVLANKNTSSYVSVLSRVPQGTVLGPLLFLIYINDLPANLCSDVRMFADDCVIYRPITKSSDIQLLQSDIDCIRTWCNKWLMSLNEKKTSLLSFHQRHCQPASNYSISNSEITEWSINTWVFI